jgi:hypothetical protein
MACRIDRHIDPAGGLRQDRYSRHVDTTRRELGEGSPAEIIAADGARHGHSCGAGGQA